MKHDYPRDRAICPPYDWTPERKAELLRLAKSSDTMAVIAQKLGHPSRNAIIGKIHRLRKAGHDIPLRCAPPTQYAPRRKAKPKPPATLVAVNGKTPSVANPESGNGKRPIRIPRVLPKPVEIPTGNLCSILDVTGCKFPVRRCDKTVGKHLFCNAEKAENVPYCSHHLAVTWKAA